VKRVYKKGFMKRVYALGLGCVSVGGALRLAASRAGALLLFCLYGLWQIFLWGWGCFCAVAAGAVG
jgi:hypothetical protein